MFFRTTRFIPLLIFGLPVLAASSSSVPGIENFHQVDSGVYRGAQPTKEGIGYLAKLGVRVVLDLREPGGRSRAEEQAVAAAGMRYVNVPMTGLTAPTQVQANTILTLLEDASSGPVFVHCMRGADRTGAVIAAYRIDHDGWDRNRALKEALADGMSWFQFPRQKFVRNFQSRATGASDATTAEVVAGAKN
jgi:tyrosine-protein phosphatase SIW14